MLAVDALTVFIQILVPVLTLLSHFHRNLPFEHVGHASELYVSDATAETPVESMDPSDQPETLRAVGWYAMSSNRLNE